MGPNISYLKYLFSDEDLENMKKESNSPFDEYTKLVYQDNMLPIMESGQATMIDDSTDLGREINPLDSRSQPWTLLSRDRLQ